MDSVSVTRQKRMVIDGEVHALDFALLSSSPTAVGRSRTETGKFKAAYKGQMELYLRWLEENEQESNESRRSG